MQNLPITITTQPVAPAQTSSPADNSNTPQTSETFGNVLARQRANSGESNKDTRDKSQATSSAASASSTGNESATTGNELEASTPDAISILPGDMLMALLPAPADAKGIATNEKSALQAPTPDGVSTLPSDMLAALLVTPVAARQGAITAARQQPNVADVQGSVLQQPTVNDLQGGAWQKHIAAGVPQGGAGQSIGEKTATSLFGAQNNATPKTAVTDTNQGNTFSAALEALSKGAATNAGTTQISTQAALPDATAMSSLIQGNPSPIAASQNGPVPIAINTPVTHDAWGDEFNQKITWIATQHEQTAELHLNPPHLGPLDVVLNISGDQATALFTSPHAAVRDAVEQALPKLREMLADNGIMLGNAMVNDQSPREQQAEQANKQRGGNAGMHGETMDAIPASGAVWPARRHQGMVDTFA